MQLASKMRFVAAQFVALLTDDLWKRNALHANRMAVRLAGHVADIHGVGGRAESVEANAVFAVASWSGRPGAPARVPLLRLGRGRPGSCAGCASFDTTEEDVDEFARAVAKAMDGLPLE